MQTDAGFHSGKVFTGQAPMPCAFVAAIQHDWLAIDARSGLTTLVNLCARLGAYPSHALNRRFGIRISFVVPLATQPYTLLAYSEVEQVVSLVFPHDNP